MSNPASSLFLAVWCVGSAAVAQAPTIVSQTDTRAMALGAFSQTVLAGTAVDYEVGRSASNPGSGGASFVVRNQGDRVEFECAAGADPGSSASVSDGTGIAPAIWLWTLPGPRDGELWIDVDLLLTTLSPQCVLEIDVGADGAAEVALSGTSGGGFFYVPVQGANGVVVEIRALAAVAAGPDSGICDINMSMAYVDAFGVRPTEFFTVDQPFGCTTSELHGASTSGMQHQLALSAVGGPPGGTALLLLGLEPFDPFVPLPQAPSCSLMVQPFVSAPATLDATGSFRWDLAVTPGQVLFLFTQHVTLDSAFTFEVGPALQIIGV